MQKKVKNNCPTFYSFAVPSYKRQPILHCLLVLFLSLRRMPTANSVIFDVLDEEEKRSPAT